MADKEHKKIIIKKVKKGGHGGAHGGSWKVAYADFVTAMMAFFLVMWLVNSLPKEKKVEISKYFQSYSLLEGSPQGLVPATDLSQIAQEQNPPNIVEPISENPSSPAKEKSEAEKAAEAIKEAIEAKTPDMKDQITVKTEAGKVIVDVFEDAKGKPLFALGRSDLTPDAKRALAAVAPAFAKAGKGLLTIEGHTDAFTYAGERFTNWELSTERASAARRELERSGVSQDSIGQVAGFAATKPMEAQAPFSPKNRRIRLVMTVPQPVQPSKSPDAAKGQSPAKAQQAPAAPPAPPPDIPMSPEKREILDQQIERLYDQSIKDKQKPDGVQ